jgi:hypothetical protein
MLALLMLWATHREALPSALNHVDPPPTIWMAEKGNPSSPWSQKQTLSDVGSNPKPGSLNDLGTGTPST